MKLSKVLRFGGLEDDVAAAAQEALGKNGFKSYDERFQDDAHRR